MRTTGSAGPAGPGTGAGDVPADDLLGYEVLTPDGQAHDPLADVLPGDDPVHRSRLPARSKTYWRVQALLVGVPLVLIAAVVASQSGWLTPTVRWAAVAVIAAWLLGYRVLVSPTLRHRTFWYAVSEREIDVQHGVFVTTRTVVPMNRVQFCKTLTGPVADRFAVAGLAVHTAAGAVPLDALDRDEAYAVRARIARLAHLADDV